MTFPSEVIMTFSQVLPMKSVSADAVHRLGDTTKEIGRP